jgi:hypothetical protein
MLKCNYTPDELSMVDAKFGWSTKPCPFSGFAHNCSSECPIFVIRYDRMNHRIKFAGCSLKWQALCTDKF